MAIYNYPFYIMPIIPDERYLRPPLLYDLMNSMVNFGQEEKIKIKNLSSVARETIFDFDYPLSTNVNKEDFETMILNKFMMRRIGYETFTAWQIQLNVKMNEIMPVYNKLFDALENWDLFTDSETFTKNSTDNRTTTNSNTSSNSSTSSNSTSGTNATNNNLDKRNSKLPQNEISDVQSGTYLTDYEKDVTTSQDAYNSQGSSTSSGSSNSSGTGTDADMYHEESTKNMSNINNKLNVYNTFLENRNNIMSLIFKDLDPLFYGITNSN